MRAHPIIDYPYRWFPMLVLALVLAIIQATLSWGYAGSDWLPAIIDGITTIGWLAALAYLAWFVVGYVSILQTKVITVAAGILLWIAGSFMICDIMARIAGIPYISFASTIPFRLLFGVPTWIAIILWYQLIVVKDPAQEEEFIAPQAAEEEEEKPEAQEEIIDRITVKDGSRIHIIKVDELLYIQACGDYATLVTPTGEYIKEQTMKYFEGHLPTNNFVRIHRSTIVNVTQISRVELFGKETYQVLLKNGTKLRVSLTGGIVETVPEKMENPQPFLNRAARFRTSLPMTEVRSILKQIEQTNGRTPESKKEGRIPLDIDLLSYDQQVLKPEDWQKEYVRLAFRHASFT